MVIVVEFHGPSNYGEEHAKPGRDGIPYHAYKPCIHTSAEIFSDVYRELSEAEAPDQVTELYVFPGSVSTPRMCLLPPGV